MRLHRKTLLFDHLHHRQFVLSAHVLFVFLASCAVCFLQSASLRVVVVLRPVTQFRCVVFILIFNKQFSLFYSFNICKQKMNRYKKYYGLTNEQLVMIA